MQLIKLTFAPCCFAACEVSVVFLLTLKITLKAMMESFKVQPVQPEYIFPQCVAPFMVSTNMTKNIAVNCFVKSASGFACEALNTVGHSSYTSGCLSHALQNMALTILLPDWLRMSSVLIRKLRNLAKVSQYERVCMEKEKFSEKEE